MFLFVNMLLNNFRNFSKYFRNLSFLTSIFLFNQRRPDANSELLIREKMYFTRKYFKIGPKIGINYKAWSNIWQLNIDTCVNCDPNFVSQ